MQRKILLHSTGDSELIGSMAIGLVEHETNSRFRNLDDFGNYISAKDIDYKTEDFTFTGYI